MTLVPAESPVITPEPALMFASPRVPLDHIPPVTVELNVVVKPTHTSSVPLNIPAETGEVTVTVLVSTTHVPLPIHDTV